MTDRDDLIEFSLLARSGQEPVAYEEGDTIFKTGAADDMAYVVKTGMVEIRHPDGSLEAVGPSGLFGELALIEPRTRTTTAIAKTPVEIVPITIRVFLFLISEEPNFALNVLKLLVRRLRAADLKVAG